MMRERILYLRPWREFIFRANPGETLQFQLFATRYGEPYTNVTVNMAAVPVLGTNVSSPEDGVTGWQDGVQTNENGIATFILRAGFIGTPRSNYNIDGQVYHFDYFIVPVSLNPQVQPSDQTLTSINVAAVLVFSNVSYTRPYTWIQHVQPIFSQYAQLYPAMMHVVNMSNYTDVKLKTGALLYALGNEVTHPSYMPVTRDLSTTKRNMILEWLNGNCLYDQNGNIPATQVPECQFNEENNYAMQNQTNRNTDIPLPESCMQGLQEGEPPDDSYSLSPNKLP